MCFQIPEVTCCLGAVVVWQVLSDPEVRKYVGGVAMQWAGKYAVQRVHETWPEIPLIQSEVTTLLSLHGLIKCFGCRTSAVMARTLTNMQCTFST